MKNRYTIYQQEEQFHDTECIQRKRLSFFYKDITSIARDYFYKLLGDIKDKKILELGCGYGSNIVIMAKKGACVTGIDISSRRVSEANSLIERENLKANATVIKMNAENLEFPDESFDLVVGMAILHHLDLELVLPEISRVLKENGEAIFLEPLGGNPIINYYRKRTPDLRTPDEHPLVEKDFEIIYTYFDCLERKNFFLLTFLAYMFKLVTENEKIIKKCSSILNAVDQLVMAVFPFFGRFCWQTVIHLRKKDRLFL